MKDPKSIDIQGGWDAAFSSRSADSSLTVIDGGGSGSVLSIEVSNGVGVTVGVEGFTVRNGKAAQGAGIRVNAGGDGSTITLVLNNNTVIRNASSDRGGGIFIQAIGGYVDVTLTNNTISENTANNEGAGIRVFSRSGGTALVRIANNVISGNAVTHSVGERVGWEGGGVAGYAGPSGTTSLGMTNNLITGNQARFGGGVFGHTLGSGALLTIEMTNNIVAGNKADYGAGIFSGGLEGSIKLALANNTITTNVGGMNVEGKGTGGIHLISDGALMSLTSQNDIVWGNAGPPGIFIGVAEGRPGSATMKASYSNIGPPIRSLGGVYTLDETMDKDPLFVNPGKGVFLLRDASPCIDAGDPGSAYNDVARPPAGGTGRNDMGAYGGPNGRNWASNLLPRLESLPSPSLLP